MRCTHYLELGDGCFATSSIRQGAGGSAPSSHQDVVGARIVIDGGRREQNDAVERVMQAFQLGPKAPVKVDRREKPSHGYRAVHVIVYEDSRDS